MKKRVFIVKNHNDDYVRVQEGLLGFWPIPEKFMPADDNEADLLNASLGNTPAEAEAAKGASMFGWEKFEKLLNVYNMPDSDDEAAFSKGYKSAGPDGP